MKVERVAVGAVMESINHGESCRARTGASCHYYEKSAQVVVVGGGGTEPVAGSNYRVCRAGKSLRTPKVKQPYIYTYVQRTRLKSHPVTLQPRQHLP